MRSFLCATLCLASLSAARLAAEVSVETSLGLIIGETESLPVAGNGMYEPVDIIHSLTLEAQRARAKGTRFLCARCWYCTAECLVEQVGWPPSAHCKLLARRVLQRVFYSRKHLWASKPPPNA